MADRRPDEPRSTSPLVDALERAPDTALGRAAAAVLARARTAWPAVDVPAGDFLAHVAERLTGSADPVAALQALHVEDLYLACACLRGHAAALKILERDFIAHIELRLTRNDALSGFADETKQLVRTRLLLRRGTLPPKLARYSGKGPLAGWLWITATRIALDLRRAQAAQGRHEALELLVERTAAPDPELTLLRAQHRPALQQAFSDVLATLNDHERALLRMHFVGGLTSAEIGRVLGGSRWTVNRELTRVCARLLREVRRLLAARLGLPASQLDTIMRALRSDSGLSVRDFLS